MGRLGISELFLIVIVAILYFLPAILGRKKRNADSICILNFFLGWTLIGWVVALVWAVSKDREIIINNPVKETRSKSDDLITLRELLDDGTLTKEEFEEEKKRVLRG